MEELKTLKKVWLITPIVLSILGLASLVDNILTWYLFMKDKYSTFHQYHAQGIYLPCGKAI